MGTLACRFPYSHRRVGFRRSAPAPGPGTPYVLPIPRAWHLGAQGACGVRQAKNLDEFVEFVGSSPISMANLVVAKSNGVARVTLTKPPVNVIDLALMKEINAALEDLRADAAAQVVVIGAQGKLFSAGVDVKDHTADRVEEMLREFHRVIRSLGALAQPTVAAVQGSALGGGMELALACDFIVASAAAKFGQPEIQVGVFPPIAALLLSRLIPRKRAFELILTGDAMDAATAERLGLVNVVAAPEEFEAAVDAFVARLTKLSGAVLKLAKRAARVPLRGADDEALREIERIYLDELMSTEDANEGVAAFVEKRKPVWKDR
jgi:cyclohexa-1,5-dienecarbonyl-CoA hydratase